MKILLVTMQFGSGYDQGTERYVGSLGEALAARGHAVGYLAGDPLRRRPSAKPGEPVDADRQIFAYPASGWSTVRGRPPRRLLGWLSEYNPDIVHVANPAHIGCGPMMASHWLRIPFVVTTMDFWWVCPKSTLQRADGTICDGTPGWQECLRCCLQDHPGAVARMAGSLPKPLSLISLALLTARSIPRGGSPMEAVFWTERRETTTGCLDLAAHVIYPSEATRLAIAPHLSHGRSSVIPYGLSAEWFREPRLVSTQVKAPGELTIGFAGVLLPHKGPALLLEAVRRLGWTQARVRLAGARPDPEYLATLRSLATGLNVEFVGSLDPAGVRAFLRAADIVAVPSCWPENLPFSLLEAQAAAVPVVASRMPGIAAQVPDSGLLFDVGSVEGLASSLEFARRRPELGAAAQVRSVDEMVSDTETVYADALRWNSANEGSRRP